MLATEFISAMYDNYISTMTEQATTKLSVFRRLKMQNLHNMK